MRLKLGVITHYREMEERFAHLESWRSLNCELHFKVGVMEYAVQAAREMEKELQCHAILASAATAKVLERCVEIPVIPLHIRNDNLYEALHQARALGSNIAFADINKQVLYNIDKVAEVLGCNIEVFSFDDLAQTGAIVDQAIAANKDVLVTPASCMYRCASKSNLPAVLIRLTEQDIIDAVDYAKKILKIKDQQVEQTKWVNAVVHNTTEGIVTVDHNRTVTLANDAALDALKLTAKQLVGRDLRQLKDKGGLLDDILGCEEDFSMVKSEKQQYVVSRQDIQTELGYSGSVIRLNELKTLQRTELRARKCMNANGFTATNTFDDIIGTSKKIRQAKSKALRYAQSGATVLILGESGCGKEIFAQSIHNASPCANSPFVAVNCATLSETLLDSELFGYEDGAFTGARKGGSPGLFEMAHNGTLFLDEIGEMPIHLQAKLLRVLQEKVVRRIGGNKNIPVNVRTIFATNKDLYEAVRNKTFREDLYYRINVLKLKLPPLRERREDIPALLEHLIHQNDVKSFFGITITPGQFLRLQSYHWYGNVRELSNFADRLVAMNLYTGDDTQLVDSLLDELFEAAAPPSEDFDHLVVPVGTIREIEHAVIRELYQRCGGKKSEVERILDMSSTTIWRRFKEMDWDSVPNPASPDGLP